MCTKERKSVMNIKKLTLTAFFVAIAVAGSLFSFPVLGSRCSPIHDHGHRDHNDNEENKGAGKVSAADQQLNVRDWERPSL